MSIYKNKKGFTLLEILIVIAVATILVTMAVSSLRTHSMTQEKNAAANAISSLIMQARIMARSTSMPVTLTINTVQSPPGGSITASIGAPVNWTQTVSLGTGDYKAVGLVGNPIGPFTISPRGTVSPGGFTLNIKDIETSDTVTVTVGVLGDITVSS